MFLGDTQSGINQKAIPGSEQVGSNHRCGIRGAEKGKTGGKRVSVPTQVA